MSAEMAEHEALSLLLRRAARNHLGLAEGEPWPSTVADAQAMTVLASDWLAAREAAAEARGAERALRGIRFRVETACDGYANLTDDDVPGGVTDTAAYQEGAHDAAEAIRDAAGRWRAMTLDIEGVLAGHRVNYHHRNVGGETAATLRYTSCDGCGWLGGWHDEAGWEAHVAAVLREQIAAAQAEAYDLAADAVPTPEQRVTIRAANPYRAAQVAPSRVPGEGS